MPVIEKLLKKENKLLAELKELNGEKAKKGKIKNSQRSWRKFAENWIRLPVKKTINWLRSGLNRLYFLLMMF